MQYFLLLFFFLSCSSVKLIPPEIKQLQVKSIKLNQNGKIELNIFLNIFNPNEKDLSFTVTALNIFRDEKLLSSLAEELPLAINRKEEKFLEFAMVLEDENLIKGIYNFLTQKKIVLTFTGDILYHHRLGDVKVDFSQEEVINLQDLFF